MALINVSAQSAYETARPAPIPIVVTRVDNALLHSSDLSRITCYEMTDLVVTCELAVPDRMFALPLRRDDGRLVLFPAHVVDGVCTVALNFPTSGQYHYTSDEANIDLPPGTFAVQPIKIDVLRKPPA
jgi:hypothetical protein